MHCYQRTINGGLLFYNDLDHLVYFTTCCVTAEKYGIRILGLCQMPDHIHDSIIAGSLSQLAAFKRDVNSQFARRQNEYCGLEGPVFEHPFGSAVKEGAKRARTNLIYVGNNPVERQLVSKAEKYRWNYIAYAHSSHPFSDKIVKASKAMKRAMKEVDLCHESHKPLHYGCMKRLYKSLTPKEEQQLTDYIISTYNIINHKATLEFFDGSYSNYLNALHSNTGAEHDINERFVGRSDECYNQIKKLLMNEYHLKDIHDIFKLDAVQLYNQIRQKTMVPRRQILKYLRLED